MINKRFVINKNIIEIKNKLFSLLKEYFNLRMKLSLNKLRKTHLIKVCKKNIVRLKSFLYKKK